jgi:hypothetical protein
MICAIPGALAAHSCLFGSAKPIRNYPSCPAKKEVVVAEEDEDDMSIFIQKCLRSSQARDKEERT